MVEAGYADARCPAGTELPGSLGHLEGNVRKNKLVQSDRWGIAEISIADYGHPAKNPVNHNRKLAFHSTLYINL